MKESQRLAKKLTRRLKRLLVPIQKYEEVRLMSPFYEMAERIVKEGNEVENIYIWNELAICFYKDFTLAEVYDFPERPLSKFLQTAIEHHTRTQELLNGGDYSSVLNRADKRLGFMPYFKIFDMIPDEQKAELFIEAHLRQEYGFEDIKEEFLRELISYPRPTLKIPGVKGQKEITIYRGQCSESTPAKRAYSWTTDPDVAMFFAKRFNFDGKGKIYEAKIDLENIVVYTNDRKEHEVIVLPSCLEDITLIKRVKEAPKIESLDSLFEDIGQ